MESMNFNLELTEEQKKYREECISFCMNNSYVLNFLLENNLDMNFVKDHSSKLKEWALNKQVCTNCKGLNECKFNQGRTFELKMDDEFLTQVYSKCRYFKEKEEQNEYLKNYVLYHGNDEMKCRNFENADFTSQDIASTFKVLTSSVSESKGVYLHGKPGVGKTYLMNCLGHLYVKKGMKVAFINSPTLISDLKNNFGISGYSEDVLNKLKKCEILILDDIGGESISAWSRDEVFMPLLNERMEKGLKTYFTSNYDFKELEEHFSIDSRGNVDKIKANRLMERIKAVSQEKTLKGMNRRL